MKAGSIGAGLYVAWACVPPRGRSLALPRYLEQVPEELRIGPVATQQMDALLPLIAAYQRFYEVERIDDERNRAFFTRFLAPSEDGTLLGAWQEGQLLGYACLYWHFTSL